MKSFIVLYRNTKFMDATEPPAGFYCEASDLDEVEYQFHSARPDCDIMWIVDTDDYAVAVDLYMKEFE